MNRVTIEVTLERIRRASVFWAGRIERQTKPTGDWHTHGCRLMWAIYERAAFDHWLGNQQLTADQAASAKRTALTGWITTPAGRGRNILEALNIDPAWAARQWATAEEYQEAA